MKDKIKNILNLSKISIKENHSQLNFIDMETKTIDKGSILLWAYIVVFFGITYLSLKLINGAREIGKPEIFINGLFLFLEIIIILKTIMLSTNIFYFSKDIENILYLPFKPIEILISKYLSILFLNYEIILLFGLIPIFLYGHLSNLGLNYVIKILPVLLLFPILWTTIISIIMMFLMKTIKIFKSKDTMQMVISIILIIILMASLTLAIRSIFSQNESTTEEQKIVLDNINNKIVNVNKYFININPSINILQKNNTIINFLILILSNVISILIFIYLGKRLYLKQLLKANFYYKNKKIKKLGKTKKKNKAISYIKKEFKMLIKNPMFFIQSIYPVIMTTITICVALIIIVPKASELLNTEEYKEQIQGLKLNIEIVCIILGTIQFVGLSNYSSVTAYSREGKDAYIIKYLPISLYKQFIYKNMPQIIINTISNIFILLTIKLQIPAIETKYIILMFIITFLLTAINSFILVLIDLLMPKLKWNAEYEILKNNKNKLLQYVLIIINILLLIFVNKVFKTHTLDKSLYVITLILMLIFIIFNYIVYKQKNKLYKKIN